MATAIAEDLSNRGHQVRVVTGYPNRPGGKLFPGYRQRPVHVERDGDVEVRRVPLFISHTANPIARILNFLSFVLSCFTASGFVRGADIVYVYATPMTVSIPAQVWHRLWRIPYVLHVQDLWPESITGSAMVKRSWAKRLVDRVLTPWLASAYRHAAGLIAIAPTMKSILIRRGAPADRVHTVFNWADETGSSLPDADVPGLTLVYAGNLGMFQDVGTIVEAARRTSDLDGLRVVIVGTGAEEARLRKLGDGLPNIEFRGAVPPQAMPGVYAESDFQLVTLKDLPVFRGTVPSKLQGSLAAGVPVITTVAGDVASIVEGAGVGLVADPEDAESLARVFREAWALSLDERQAMGRRAKEHYAAAMSRSAGVDEIERVLAGAATAAGRYRESDKT